MTSAFEQFNLTKHYVSAAVYHQILCCRVSISFNFLKGTKFSFYWSFPHFAFCNTVVEIDNLACWHIECRCRYENVSWTEEITTVIYGWKKVWHSLFNFKMILDVFDDTIWFSWCFLPSSANHLFGQRNWVWELSDQWLYHSGMLSSVNFM